MPNNPVGDGCVWWAPFEGSGWVHSETVFPLVVSGVWLLSLGSGCIWFTVRDHYGSVAALFRVVVGFLLCGLVSNGLRVVDQASTESLILAQDERWRRA